MESANDHDASVEAQTSGATAHKLDWKAALESKLLIGFVAAIGAAVAPLTAYVSKHQEIELERAKQEHAQTIQEKDQSHKVRMDFLEKVISFERDKPGDSYYRRDVLKFFASTLDEGPLRHWAASELAVVQEEVDRSEKLQSELSDANERLTKLRMEIGERQAEASRLNDKLDRARSYGVAASVRVAELKKSKDELAEQVAHSTAELSAQESRVATLEGQSAAYRVLAVARSPCPPGTSLQTSRGSGAENLAKCMQKAPSGANKTSIWSVTMESGGDLNCMCR
jgi:DNA repair exonuclease SbcCD ATPase subunit